MKFFWPIYLASLVVGTAGVYVAAPLARPYTAGLLGTAGREAPPAALPETPPPPAAGLSRAADDDDDVADPDLMQQEAREQREEADSETPPALLGVYLASHGDRPGWGVTAQRTTYYKLDGSRVGNLPGGVLFDCSKAHQSSKGLMLEFALPGKASTNGTFLVSRSEVFLFTGARTNLSSRQREALQSYYRIKGQIGARKTELLQASAAKNPYFAAANAAYKAFAANTQKAQELSAKRNTATELDKVRLEDELRELKVKETRLRADLTAANEKFRVWKEQHAAEVAKPENDPEVQKLTEQLNPLRKIVPGLTM